MLFEKLFYPDLEERRKAVQQLATQIHTKVVEIFSSMEDIGSEVHRLCNEFQEVPEFDDTKSYDANFNALADTLAQWVTTAKKQYQNIDTVSADIKALVEKLAVVNPHSPEDLKAAREEMVSMGRDAANIVIGLCTSKIVLKTGASVVKELAPLIGKGFARIATLCAEAMVEQALLSEVELTEAIEAEAAIEAEGVAIASSGGLLGGFAALGISIVGAAVVFVLADAIFDAIAGAMERKHLAEVRSKYEEEYNKLVANAQKIRTAARKTQHDLMMLSLMVAE